MTIAELLELPPYEWPEDTYDIVIGTLRDPEAPLSEREGAAELAGDLMLMDDKLAGVLMELFQDRNAPDGLRVHAALSMGAALEDASCADDFEDTALSEEVFERVAGTLRTVYEDEGASTELRRRALEASVRAEQEWHQEAVRKAWEGDAEWHLTAVFCMRFVSGFDQEILLSLESEDTDVLYEGVLAAGEREVAEAWHRVVSLAHDADADPDVRFASFEATALLRPAEARAALGDLLDSDDEDVAGAVEEVLEMADAYQGMFEDDEDEDEDDD